MRVTVKTIWHIVLSGLSLTLSSCDHPQHTPDSHIRFATSADYPPFEYRDKGQFVGFDIALAQAIAKALGKEAVFVDVQFSSILAALDSGIADAGISTITATSERHKSFDFSETYYAEHLSVISKKDRAITDKAQLPGKIVACQLGTTMEIWLRKHANKATIVTVDNNNQAIESLKAGHVDAIVMNEPQAVMFAKNNPNLSQVLIAQSDDGYAIAFRKGSPLREKINQTLNTFKQSGLLETLKNQWINSAGH